MYAVRVPLHERSLKHFGARIISPQSSAIIKQKCKIKSEKKIRIILPIIVEDPPALS